MVIAFFVIPSTPFELPFPFLPDIRRVETIIQRPTYEASGFLETFAMGSPGGSTVTYMPSSLDPTGGKYTLYMDRHCTGQTSTHRLQVQHFKLSIRHSLSSLLTARALVGQFFSQSRQKIQRLMSFSTLPLVASGKTLFLWGCIRVEGFPNRLFIITREIPGNPLMSALSPTVQYN
jgi:hypothetical protein